MIDQLCKNKQNATNTMFSDDAVATIKALTDGL